MGLDVSNITVKQANDIVKASINTFPPKICSIADFYPEIKEEIEEREKHSNNRLDSNTGFGKGRMFKQGVRTAEQFIMLAKMGLVQDNRGKKN